MKAYRLILSIILSCCFSISFSQVGTEGKTTRKLLDTNEIVYSEQGIALKYYQYTHLINSGDYSIRLSGPSDDPQTKRYLKKLTVQEQMQMFESVKTRLIAKSPLLQEGNKLSMLPVLEVLNGEEIEQKVKVFIFWSSWCPPCTDSFASLNEVFRQVYNPQEVLILAITRDGGEVAKAKLKEKPLLYAKFIHNATPVYDAYNLNSIPTFVITDKNDTIVFSVTGLGPQVIAAFKNHLRALVTQ